MTDHKFTDDDVIKALKFCAEDKINCAGCRFYVTDDDSASGCRYLIELAVNLLERQKAELDTLKTDTIPKLENALERANYYGLKADEEIEYLKSEKSRLITSNSQLEARVCEDRKEIEALTAVHADMTESLRLAAEANKDMAVELDAMRGAANSYKMHYEKARAEAIKEFAWRLKNILTPYPEGTFFEEVSSHEIDNLVKEMTEDLK